MVQNWLMPSFFFGPQIPSISRSARWYRDNVFDFVQRWERRKMQWSWVVLERSGKKAWCGKEREEEDVQEAKENTQVTPNRSMSEAHGLRCEYSGDTRTQRECCREGRQKGVRRGGPGENQRKWSL